jgi:predicted nucleic acid-binding protein
VSHGPLVLDASLAIAWALDEPHPAWAQRLRVMAQQEPLDIRVPTFFWLEVGNILVRQPGMTHDQMLEGLIRLESMGIGDEDLDRPMRLRSLELAVRHGLTTYDAVYLAFAVDLGAPLATLDAALGRAASSHGLRYGDDHPRTAREQPLGYKAGRGPDPVSLAAIGAYVARLRRVDGDEDAPATT